MYICMNPRTKKNLATERQEFQKPLVYNTYVAIQIYVHMYIYPRTKKNLATERQEFQQPRI